MRQKSFFVKLAFAVMLMASPSQAVQNLDHKICDHTAAVAAQETGIPLTVLMAIARVETGRVLQGQLTPWPWAANISGQSHYFNSKSEAVAFAQSEIDKGNINFDVGCFQVNLRWHSKGFSSLEAALDPLENASYAARFLGKLFAEKGNWSDAVAAYHSRTPDYAAVYLEKVKSLAGDLNASGGDVSPSDEMPYQTIAERKNNYPLLQLGQGENGSLVPQQLPRGQKFSLR